MLTKSRLCEQMIERLRDVVVFGAMEGRISRVNQLSIVYMEHQAFGKCVQRDGHTEEVLM